MDDPLRKFLTFFFKFFFFEFKKLVNNMLKNFWISDMFNFDILIFTEYFFSSIFSMMEIDEFCNKKISQEITWPKNTLKVHYYQISFHKYIIYYKLTFPGKKNTECFMDKNSILLNNRTSWILTILVDFAILKADKIGNEMNIRLELSKVVFKLKINILVCIFHQFKSQNDSFLA